MRSARAERRGKTASTRPLRPRRKVWEGGAVKAVRTSGTEPLEADGALLEAARGQGAALVSVEKRAVRRPLGRLGVADEKQVVARGGRAHRRVADRGQLADGP